MGNNRNRRGFYYSAVTQCSLVRHRLCVLAVVLDQCCGYRAKVASLP